MKPDGMSLIEIISDVFAGKADFHEPDIVAAYFAERPDLLRDLHEPRHQAILGRRGTGKTMVLKYLSFPSQLHRSPAPVSADAFRFDLVGFYISLDPELQPTMGPEHDSNLEPVFGHWFNLVTVLPVLDAVELLRKNPHLRPQSTRKFISELSNMFLGRRASSIDQLRADVQKQITEILDRSYLVKPQAISQLLSYAQQLPKLTSPRSFHNALSSLLTTFLAPTFRRSSHIFFLLDRFDEVPAARQAVIKHIIQWRQNQPYWVKFGVADPEKLNLTGLTSQDYRVVNIEHDLTPSFCETVLEKRFAVVREKMLKEGLPQEFTTLFNHPGTLLPGITFQRQADRLSIKPPDQRGLWSSVNDPELLAFRTLLLSNSPPIFSGIDHLARISSGCIRIFIETTHRVLRHVLLTSDHVLLNQRHIPPDIQNQAILEESNQRFSQELSASLSAAVTDETTRVATKKLLGFLLKKFQDSLKADTPHLHSFSLEETISETEDKLLVDSILALNRLGLITPAGGVSSLEAGARYTVSRLFAPREPLPPIEQGCLRLSRDDLRGALDPRFHKGRSASEPALGLLETLQCFYATGFRHEWENSLRSYLKERVFPENQLQYFDGEEYDIQSQEIGRAVLGLLSRVDFFIAEISDYNENVCYEIGLGIAVGKWCFRIKNKLHKGGHAHPRVEELLTSLKYQEYQFSPGTATEEGRILMLQSIHKAVGTINRWYRDLRPEDRRNVNPFDKSRPLHLMHPPDFATVLLFSDPSEPMASWVSDLKIKLREDLGLLAYDDPGSGYSGPSALKYLEAAARSTHCVIDITDKNPFSAFLLGYAVGRGRATLAVWRRGTDSLITNYRGEAGRGEYSSKDELWSLVRTFVQAPMEKPR